MTLPTDSSRDEWPLKAYKNIDFLNSDPARNIRILCEMTEPGLRFAKQNVEDTIVLFGSARTKPIAIAERELGVIKSAIKDPENLTVEEKRSLQQAERAIKSAPYYDAAVQLSESLTRWSMSLS
jgi:hypothetical protein